MKDKINDIPYELPKFSPKLNKRGIEHLYDFITERHSIYKKREKGLPAPWTDNPVLQNYKFTNVRREHDRTTKHLINTISKNPNLTYEQKIINTIVYRLYCKIETADVIDLSKPLSLDKLDEYNNRLSQLKTPLYTNAYNTGGLKYAQRLAFPEIQTAVRPIATAFNLFSTRPDFDSPSTIVEWLSSANGIGFFLSYQIFVDFTYIDEFPFSENHFVIAGPGAQIGLLHIYTDADGMNHEQQLFYLTQNLERLFKKIRPEFDINELFDDLPEYDRKFNVMSIQNCMCELGKYIRTVDGLGRPKVTYNGRSSK